MRSAVAALYAPGIAMQPLCSALRRTDVWRVGFIRGILCVIDEEKLGQLVPSGGLFQLPEPLEDAVGSGAAEDRVGLRVELLLHLPIGHGIAGMAARVIAALADG